MILFHHASVFTLKIESKVVCKMKSLRSGHSLKNYSFTHIACVCVCCVYIVWFVWCVCVKISSIICHRELWAQENDKEIFHFDSNKTVNIYEFTGINELLNK